MSSATPSPSSPSPVTPSLARDRASAPPRPWWRTLFAAQESGLVVVIVLMMVALTIFGGTKPSNFNIAIPAGAQVEEVSETRLAVTISGARVEHDSDSPFRVRDQDDGSKIAFGTKTVNKFLEKSNLVQVTTSASFIAVMAVGMTAIIILAGIDLSIGSIYAMAAILGAMAVSSMQASAIAPLTPGGPPGPGLGAALAVPVLILVCCSVGAACGFANGFSSVVLRVHPFIITLGTMAIYRGLVFVMTQGQTVGGLPDSVQSGFFKFDAGGVYPVPTFIMLLIAAIGMFMLARTVLGRRVYAVGGNEVAAKYAGIPVGRVKTIVYTLSGALAGLSAAMYVGYYGAAETNAGNGYELNVIAAAVIGGASLSGGRGSAVGAVLGAILVQLINNAMLILDINQSYNQIVMGLAIILAVVVDQTKSRLSK